MSNSIFDIKIEFFLCHATLVKTGATVTIFILVIESKIPIFSFSATSQ